MDVWFICIIDNACVEKKQQLRFLKVVEILTNFTLFAKPENVLSLSGRD